MVGDSLSQWRGEMIGKPKLCESATGVTYTKTLLRQEWYVAENELCCLPPSGLGFEIPKRRCSICSEIKKEHKTGILPHCLGQIVKTE